MQVLDACLKEISTALLQADVNVKLVMNLRTNVKTRANNADKGAGLNKRKIIEKAVVDELSSMLSSGTDEKKLADLKKGQPNVVMFVGLQACAHNPLFRPHIYCWASPIFFLYNMNFCDSRADHFDDVAVSHVLWVLRTHQEIGCNAQHERYIA